MFKRSILMALAVLALAFSCRSTPKLKAYKYIEVKREQSKFGEYVETRSDPEIIIAENDSIAYCAAYQKFCIAQKKYQDVNEEFGKFNHNAAEPTGFHLVSPSGSYITNSVNFHDFERVKKEIREKVSSMIFVIEGTGNRMELDGLDSYRKAARIDSTTIKKLKPGFKIKKDEFDTKGTTWYTPRTAPNYVNYNALYLYFGCQEGVPTVLRWRMQYEDDNWLFIRLVQFSIDGKPYEYVPNNMETDSGNGGRIWEWFDNAVDYRNKEIVLALYNAKTARMRLVGSQYHKEKTITSSQLSEIRKTIDLYKAMGGTL